MRILSMLGPSQTQNSNLLEHIFSHPDYKFSQDSTNYESY